MLREQNGKWKDMNLNSVHSADQRLSFFLIGRDYMKTEEEIRRMLNDYKTRDEAWKWTAEIVLLMWVLGEEKFEES